MIRQGDTDIAEHVEQCGREIREHMYMAVEGEDGVVHWEDNFITEESVRKCLTKRKTKKASGPDGIKPEFFKVFTENSTLLKILLKILNYTLYTQDVPEG